MKAVRSLIAVWLTGFSAAWGASAGPGLVHYTEGKVYLGERAIEASAWQFPQMRDQDTLRTEEGRAEVLLGPGSFLRIGENSSIRMLSVKATGASIELLHGTLILEAADIAKKASLTLIYKENRISIVQPGLYRLGTDPQRLRIIAGKARVESGGLTPVSDPLPSDALDRWSGRRAGYLATANIPSAWSLRNSKQAWRSSNWSWNPYFGMFTFVPAKGAYGSPYGFRFFSPTTVIEVYRKAP